MFLYGACILFIILYLYELKYQKKLPFLFYCDIIIKYEIMKG